MLGITEQLLHATIRIECLDAKGVLSSGTGYFFNFAAHDGNICPAIITNKHVVAGQSRGFFHLTLAKADGEPDYGKHERVELLDFAACWLEHPDPNVDLAMCLIGGLFNHLDQMGKRPFYRGISKEIIPSAAELQNLNAVEDIMMIGYPNGLWDAKNNLPIVRRGITATPAYQDYNERDEFLIDAACFPGSSGSPVFIVNQGLVYQRGNTNLGTSRLMFLGVLYAGPVATATGRIVFEAAPTSMQPIPVINMMMNLGICIRSAKVLDFELMLVQKGVIPPGAEPLTFKGIAAEAPSDENAIAVVAN
jgi:V8-like Glu-specific endopeptidase